jgi:triacylglycerol lipase
VWFHGDEGTCHSSALFGAIQGAPSGSSAPIAEILNGTYIGVKNTAYNQDIFLGIPHAQQPVGNLQFTAPQSLNESWEDARDAKEYSEICVGYGVSHQQ